MVFCTIFWWATWADLSDPFIWSGCSDLLWWFQLSSKKLADKKKHGESRWFPYLLNLAKVAAFFWSSISDNLYKHTKVRKVKKRALICTLNVPTLPFIVGIFQYVHSPLTSSGRISSHPYTMHGHVEVYASCKLFGIVAASWNKRLATGSLKFRKFKVNPWQLLQQSARIQPWGCLVGDGLHTEKNAKHVGRLDVIASDSKWQTCIIYIHPFTIHWHTLHTMGRDGYKDIQA